MIYVASLSVPVKKAFGDKCYITSVPKIIANLNMDPSLSGMDACLVGPKDIQGLNKTKFNEAMKYKHANICVIYVCQKDKELEGVSADYKTLLKKINEETVLEYVNTCINTHSLSEGQQIVSRDTKAVPVIASKPLDTYISPVVDDAEEVKVEVDDEEELDFDETLGLYYRVLVDGSKEYCTVMGVPLSQEQIEVKRVSLQSKAETAPVEPKPAVLDATTETKEDQLTKNIQSLKDFRDWNVFKEALQKDKVVRSLLEENSTYQGVSQMLDILNEEIISVYNNTTLPADVKFEKVTEIGRQRSRFVEQHNDIISRKVIELMNSITGAAQDTVEELIKSHKRSIQQVYDTKLDVYPDELMQLVQDKATAEFELLSAVKSIINLYQAMDGLVDEVVLDLDKNIPSNNEFINNMYKGLGEVLTPNNSKALSRLLMDSLRESRGTLAFLQDGIETVIDSIHTLLQKYNAIIEHQQYIIKMLQANRVEDLVVLDSVIKSILRVYVGEAGTGRTATALTWSGCQSRQRNTLLIDLTGKGTYDNYGVVPHDLSNLISERIEEPLCIVAGVINNPEDLLDLMRELKTRLSYYAYINIVLDTRMAEELDMLAKEALSVSFITNCTPDSMRRISKVMGNFQAPNVARKALFIDPPVNIRKLAENMSIDVTQVKCITIPNVPKIKMCAITKEKPDTYSEVRAVFEEALQC